MVLISFKLMNFLIILCEPKDEIEDFKPECVAKSHLNSLYTT